MEENRPEYEDDGTSQEDQNVPGEDDKQRIIEARAADEEGNDAEEMIPVRNIENHVTVGSA